MSLIQRLNDLPSGSMTAEDILINLESHFVFIIKDTEYPDIKSKAESHFLFFIAEFEGKFLPFLYYVVKFGDSNRFIYDMVVYIHDIKPFKKLLLNEHKYCFLDDGEVNFDRIIREPVGDKLNQETIKAIELFDKIKTVNKGSADDFLKFYDTNAFWNFIGNSNLAFKKAEELYKNNGLIVDLVVSKTNTISEPEPRGCMSKTLIGSCNNN